MLVLTGKPGDTIDIDQGRIIVKILRTETGQCRLGFEAPPEVIIDRSKIVMAKAENR